MATFGCLIWVAMRASCAKRFGRVRIGRAIGAQDLDDPQLVQVDVARAIDLTHPAGGQALEDLVLAVENRCRCRARSRRLVVHRSVRISTVFYPP